MLILKKVRQLHYFLTPFKILIFAKPQTSTEVKTTKF